MLPSIAATFSEKLLFQNIHFQKSYYFTGALLFHSYTSYYLVINWVSQFKCKRSFVQFKCESSFLCIYYCSKSHHRQSLFNQLATQSAAELLLCNEPTFRVSYFFRVSTFREPYFFIRFRKGYFSRRCCFSLLTSFSQLHFSVII